MTATTTETFEQMRARVVGTALPGGTFRVAEHERWIAHDAMHAPPIPAPLLHPVWILLGALRGMGLSTEELLARAGTRPEDGALFGETEVEQFQPLRAGVEYRVSGRFTDLQRRTGRRAGTFDVLSFRLEIALAEGADSGEVVAVNQQSFILRRGHDDDTR